MPTLNAFFLKQCLSHIRKAFVASTRDFLLIFGECATLMARNVLSRGTMATGFCDISWDSHIFFFNILYSKQCLHWLYSACKVWKSLDSPFLEYPFWNHFGDVVFWLKFHHFDFFLCKKYILLDAIFILFYSAKNLLWFSKDSFL